MKNNGLLAIAAHTNIGTKAVYLSKLTGTLLLLGGLICPIAQAEDLSNLYKRAVENDPQLLSAQYKHAAAAQATRQSLANLLPTVTLDYEDVDTTQNIKSSDNLVFASGKTDFPSTTMTLTLTQPLFNYPSWVRHRQAKVEVKRSDAEFAVAQQDMILRVAELYMASLGSEDTLTFSRAEKAAVKSQLALAKGRLSSGLARKTDLYDARARYAAVEATEIEAQNILDDSLQALLELVGERPQSLAKIKDDIALVRPEPEDADAWVKASLATNPNILLQQHAAEVAREEVNRQSAGHYPSFDLLVRQNNRDTKGTLFGGGSEVETQDIVLRLTVPLYQGGYVSSRKKEAAELHQMAKQDLVQQQRGVMREARAAYYGVISAISRVNALNEAVKSQALALNAKQEGFKAGLYTGLAVLDAERDLYMARRDHAQARYDYILNTLRLKHASGILAEADIEQVNQLLQ